MFYGSAATILIAFCSFCSSRAPLAPSSPGRRTPDARAGTPSVVHVLGENARWRYA